MRLLQSIRKTRSMLITIENVLDDDHITLLSGLITGLTWQDGARTAGAVAQQVKANEQSDLTTPVGHKVESLLCQAIKANAVFQAAAQPRQISRLIVSKTGPGGAYGWHVDNPFMSANETSLRTDLSFTLFLNDPASYEGGVLDIEHAGHRQEIKLSAGSMVLYPSTSLHQVTPVKDGERLACVGWVESRIPRADDRELLFDLTNLQSDLGKVHDTQSIQMLTLSKAINNLKRRFS